MKKVLLVIAVAFVLALGLQSCKSTADCPAYGNADTEQTTVNA